MNWFNHEYLVPVIIGNGKDERVLAKKIYRAVGAKPVIFADKFGFFQRLYAICQRLTPLTHRTLLWGLCDLEKELEVYRLPLLIYSEESADFIRSHADALECRFILCEITKAYELLGAVYDT